MQKKNVNFLRIVSYSSHIDKMYYKMCSIGLIWLIFLQGTRHYIGSSPHSVPSIRNPLVQRCPIVLLSWPAVHTSDLVKRSLEWPYRLVGPCWGVNTLEVLCLACPVVVAAVAASCSGRSALSPRLAAVCGDHAVGLNEGCHWIVDTKKSPSFPPSPHRIDLQVFLPAATYRISSKVSFWPVLHMVWGMQTVPPPQSAEGTVRIRSEPCPLIAGPRFHGAEPVSKNSIPGILCSVSAGKLAGEREATRIWKFIPGKRRRILQYPARLFPPI